MLIGTLCDLSRCGVVPHLSPLIRHGQAAFNRSLAQLYLNHSHAFRSTHAVLRAGVSSHTAPRLIVGR